MSANIWINFFNFKIINNTFQFKYFLKILFLVKVQSSEEIDYRNFFEILNLFRLLNDFVKNKKAMFELFAHIPCLRYFDHTGIQISRKHLLDPIKTLYFSSQ